MNKQTMLHDDIGDLVKFKKNLRWRKWPEEKPSDYEPCICYEGKGFPVFARVVNNEWISMSGYDGREYVIEVREFIPLSALPKPENIK